MYERRSRQEEKSLEIVRKKGRQSEERALNEEQVTYVRNEKETEIRKKKRRAVKKNE